MTWARQDCAELPEWLSCFPLTSSTTRHRQTSHFPDALERKALLDWHGGSWPLKTWLRPSAYPLTTGSCWVPYEGRDRDSGSQTFLDMPTKRFAVIHPTCAEHPQSPLLHSHSCSHTSAQSQQWTSKWHQEKKKRKEVWFVAMVSTADFPRNYLKWGCIWRCIFF